jgi:hypothetical protein
MSTILGNGSVTFGDGTVQTTKTPTTVGSFTNDSNFITSSTANSTYSTINNAVYNTVASMSRNGNFTTYSINGGVLSSQGFNCNCNC